MDRQEFQRICEAIEPDERGCRIWPLGLSATGYAQISLDRYPTMGHRLALEIKLGRKIAPGLHALHSCDRPACVAYDHLEEGTHKKNMEDASARGRMAFGDRNGSRTRPDRVPRGSANGAARFNEEQVLEIDRLLRSGLPCTKIGKMFGVGRQTIGLISNGVTWSHLTGRKKS